MSWRSLNRIWVDICHILKSPLTSFSAYKAKYLDKLPKFWDLAYLGQKPRACGDMAVIKRKTTRTHTRLRAHAARRIMDLVTACDSPCDVTVGKVGGWLINEVAMMWDEVGGINHPVMDTFANLQ